MKNATFICHPDEGVRHYAHAFEIEGERFFNNTRAHLKPGAGLVTFRRDFRLPAGCSRVRLHITALGVFEVFLNGKRIGREEMKPGWTDYHCRVFEFSYDITGLCGKENTLIAPVAPGWYSGRISFGEYGYRPVGLAAELEFFGAKEELLGTLGTDTNWQCTVGGRVLFADIWDGEYTDATKADIATRPGAYSWKPAAFYSGEIPQVVPSVGEPVRYRPAFDLRPVSAVLFSETVDNGTDFGEILPLLRRVGADCERLTLRQGQVLILDFGQETVGRPRIRLQAAKGTTLEVYMSEMLNDSGDKTRGNDGPKGDTYLANYRSALARAVYVAGGEGEETLEPQYVFYGFRYFRLIADAEVEILSVTAAFLSTDMEETGWIETDNEEVNRLFRNILWGQRCNYLSIPTDCPQRDERLGWTGDTQIFCFAGTYNANARGFFRKWLGDVRDAQRLSPGYWDVIPALYGLSGNHDTYGSAAWGDAGVIVPMALYEKYGDTETLAEHYDSMEKYMDFLAGSGLHGPRERYGDWLAYDPTPTSYISLCYYAYDASLMEIYAKALGKNDRAAHYRALFEQIKKEFTRQYVRNGRLILTTQTACLLALRFDLADGETRRETIRMLAGKIKENGYRLSTGFVGTGILCQTLSKVGLDDLAYSLLLQTDEPSWLYTVRQGATTMWERWNSYTKEKGFGEVSMNSFNHYAYGAVAEWMYAYMAGIAADPETPGFSRFILRPRPDLRSPADLPAGQKRLTRVRAHYLSVRGRIESAWEWREDRIHYHFTIPKGTAARAELPLLPGQTHLNVNGLLFTPAELGGRIENGLAVFPLLSGQYTIY